MRAILTVVSISMLAGCAAWDFPGQRVSFADEVPAAPALTIRSTHLTPYLDEKAAISSLSNFDLKILAVIREIETGESNVRSSWRTEDDTLKYSSAFSLLNPARTGIVINVDWKLRTIEITEQVAKKGPELSEAVDVVARDIEARLRGKFPSSKIQRIEFRRHHTDSIFQS